MLRCATQLAKPFEVRARHGAFAVHVGAHKSRAEGFELRHHFVGLQGDARAPAVNCDVSPGSVQGDDDLFRMNCSCELLEECGVHFSPVECGASDNDLACAPSSNFCGARNGSNSAADAYVHSKIISRALA